MQYQSGALTTADVRTMLVPVLSDAANGADAALCAADGVLDGGVLLGGRHLELIIDGLPTLVTIMTADGCLAHANRQVLSYFGRTLAELRDWRTSDAVHADDLPRVIAAWQRSVQSGEPYDIEHRARRADGVYRWFHMRGLPIRDARGTIELWYHLQTDIHDRRWAEELLAGEKALLEMVACGRPLLETLDSLCSLLDLSADGCRSGVLLLDRTRTKVERALGPGLPATYSRTLEGSRVSSEAGPCGMAVCTRTQVIVSDAGTDPRWNPKGWPALALSHGLRSCWSSPILSAAGESLGTFAIYRADGGFPTAQHEDLLAKLAHVASIAIERMEADAALRRSEEFLADAQRLSATGSFSWRVSSGDIRWSEQLYRIFGIDPRSTLTQARIRQRIHPDDVVAVMLLTRKALSDAADFDADYRLLLPDGSVRCVHTIAHARRDKGDDIEYIGAVQDITARRRSEAALGKARSDLANVSRVTTLGVMAASIAHEVNQPLSGIVTNAGTCLRMLASTPPNIDGARETARRTIRDGNRAADVITRLRALYARKAAPSEPVDINDAAREVLAFTVARLQRNRVVVEPAFADDLPWVSGDRLQLQQVILNLIFNASDAMSTVMDRPRRMVIATERGTGDDVRLAVTDLGVGFDLEAHDRLFDAFYTTKADGMGIGLSVSRSIIEQHGGRLTATQNSGRGSTFSFTVPCMALPA